MFVGNAPAEHALDACSLLNLIASRRFADIAQTISARFIAARDAAGEIGYVRRGGTGAEADEREPIDLQALVAAGYLTILDLRAPAELAAFVAFAVDIDDGEAATGALAVSRQATVVTDDRKARRVFSALNPPLTVRTTSELVKAWADHVEISAEDLSRVLRDIETRARFRPGPSDPLAGWWVNARVP